jgi:hypothetical protein
LAEGAHKVYLYAMAMVGRGSGDGYRFGFNGKEDDSEWGAGNGIQDYGFRLYNSSIGL